MHRSSKGIHQVAWPIKSATSEAGIDTTAQLGDPPEDNPETMRKLHKSVQSASSSSGSKLSGMMQQPLRLPPQLALKSLFIGLLGKYVKNNDVISLIADGSCKTQADAVILLAISWCEYVWLTTAKLIEADGILSSVAIDESFRHPG